MGKCCLFCKPSANESASDDDDDDDDDEKANVEETINIMTSIGINIPQSLPTLPPTPTPTLPPTPTSTLPPTPTLPQSNNIYPCYKIGRTSHLRKRRHFLLHDDTTFVLLKTNNPNTLKDADNSRDSPISNLHCVFDDGSIHVTFKDNSTSPLIILSNEVDVPLEDLMRVLSRGYFDQREKTHHHTHQSSIDDDIASLTSSLVQPLNDSIADHIVNVNNHKTSSEGSNWELIRHETDGTKVLSSPSLLPPIPRLKTIAYIDATPKVLFNLFSNFTIRGSFDTSLKLGAVLKSFDLKDRNKLELIHYTMRERVYVGALAGRSFLEARTLVTPKNNDRESFKIITTQLQKSKKLQYGELLHGDKLTATNHNFDVDFAPFADATRTKLTIIMKTSIQGGRLHTLSSVMGSRTSSMITFLTTLVSDLRAAAAAERSTTDVVKLPKPAILRDFSTVAANFIFEASVLKGPPGIGFGMVVELSPSTGYFVVSAVHTFIRIDAAHERKTTLGLSPSREERGIKVGDIVTHLDDEPIIDYTMEMFLNRLKKVRQNQSIRMVFER